MKLLIVNNYSTAQSLKWAQEKKLPMNHVWGVDYLASNYKLRFITYKCPKWMTKFHCARFYYIYFQICTLLMSLDCSAVYSAASPLIDLLAYLKSKNILNKRLFMVVHHPNNFSLKNRSYDKLFFISRDALKKALEKYPTQSELFVYNEWGPDCDFYDYWIDEKQLNLNDERKILSFISNGKTNRDHEILVDAAYQLNAELTIICTEDSSPLNYKKEYSNVKILSQKGSIMDGKIISYPKMVEELSKHSVLVIPAPKGLKVLCGLTSYCDAMAMRMPLIISDSTHIGIDIEKEGFGFVYEAGNLDDLVAKMRLFIEDPSLARTMGEKARQYAQVHNNRKFSESLSNNIK